MAEYQGCPSRSYESSSVVIIEFQLHIDGRKAAEDMMREKVATVRPNLRTEVKSRAWCASTANRPGVDLAVLPDDTRHAPQRRGTDELGRPGPEEAPGSGGVGGGEPGGRNQARDQHLPRPRALEAFGITPDQVAAAVRNDQDLP